jgi:hypothetical protein
MTINPFTPENVRDIVVAVDQETVSNMLSLVEPDRVDDKKRLSYVLELGKIAGARSALLEVISRLEDLNLNDSRETFDKDQLQLFDN